MTMIIPNDDVADSDDLETKVAKFYNDMGYVAKTLKVIELAGRGKKEVDVYVEDQRTSVKTICIVECKWWNSSVPQDVVHGFHTVVNGCGANYGFIVTKKAFQSGADEAIRYTNITLLTFEDLQRAYGDEWYRFKLAQLTELEARLETIHRLYFEQDSIVALMNSSNFHTTKQQERYRDFFCWNRLLLGLIRTDLPKSFDTPGPIKAMHEPNPPWSAEYKNSPEGHEFASVRDYFSNVTRQAECFLSEFDAFSKEAVRSVDDLPDQDRGDLWARNFFQLAEESPIRVLKSSLGEEAYKKLVAEHLKQTFGSFPTADQPASEEPQAE